MTAEVMERQPYTVATKCRVCGSPDLTEVIQIREQYLSPTFVETNDDNPLAEIKVPMTLLLCGECGLLQLKESVHSDLLYRQYFYRSSTSTTMQNDLLDVVRDVVAKADPQPGEVVVDIGANDGWTISNFPSNLTRIGVEPARNIDWSHLDRSIQIVNDYFSAPALSRALNGRKVKTFTACAMFYDLDDPNSFVADVKSLLAPDGVWCIQLSYLALMLKNMNFYDICNEHLEYYSLRVLDTLMRRHGLMIFDASTNHVNGGSARVFITHVEAKRPVSKELESLLADEDAMNLRDVDTFRRFMNDVEDLSRRVVSHLEQHRAEGRLVIGLGASTKGNMLLQLFGITKEMMPYISERNPDKVGLRSLGIDMELISEERARELKPACMLVLPWYFKDEIVRREREYIQAGGELLFPMPYAHVVGKQGEVKI